MNVLTYDSKNSKNSSQPPVYSKAAHQEMKCYNCKLYTYQDTSLLTPFVRGHKMQNKILFHSFDSVYAIIVYQ